MKIVPVRLHSDRTKEGQDELSIYSQGIARYKGRSSGMPLVERGDDVEVRTVYLVGDLLRSSIERYA